LCRVHKRAIGYRRVAHGIESVDYQIEQDLLKLNWIRLDYWQIWHEQGFHLARLKHGIRAYHARHIHYKVVQIHALPVRDAFFYHAPDAAKHIASPTSIRNDVAEQVTKLAKIDIAAINKALSCAGVAGDSRKRLIQFMGNGRRQFTHRCHPAEMA